MVADSKPLGPVRYFFDEHVRQAIVMGLRRHGIDVLTAHEAGRAHRGIDDDEQVTYATEVGRVFVSNDTDVLNENEVPQLLTGQHAGIIYIEQNVRIGEQVRYLRYVAETETMDSLVGQLRFYEPIPRGLFPDD